MQTTEGIAYAPWVWKRLTLDLAQPADADGSICILWVHGGGWNKGDKDAFRPEIEHFARRGIAAATLNYRLSTEAIFPAQWQDVWMALDYLGDCFEMLVVAGHSAGAHLAVLAGVAAPPGYTPRHRMGLRGAIGISGVYETRAAWMRQRGYPLRSILEELFGGSYESPEVQERARQASPLEYISPQHVGASPAFLLIHGEADPGVSVEHTRLMASSLQAAGYPVQLDLIPTGLHYLLYDHRVRVLDRVEAFVRALIPSAAPGRDHWRKCNGI